LTSSPFVVAVETMAPWFSMPIGLFPLSENALMPPALAEL
jgi:hypothetical protein